MLKVLMTLELVLIGPSVGHPRDVSRAPPIVVTFSPFFSFLSPFFIFLHHLPYRSFSLVTSCDISKLWFSQVVVFRSVIPQGCWNYRWSSVSVVSLWIAGTRIYDMNSQDTAFKGRGERGPAAKRQLLRDESIRFIIFTESFG